MRQLLNIKIIYVLFIFLLLSACASTTNYFTPEVLKPIAGPYQVLTLWSQNIDDGSTGFKLKLALCQNTIFAAGKNGKVTALNSKNGKILWQANLQTTISAGVACNGKYVAVASKQGQLYLLNEKNGNLLWQQAISDTALASPVFAKKFILVKTIDGNLTVYNIKTRKKVWQYSALLPDVTLRGGSSPIVNGNIVVAGFANGVIVAYKLSTGQVLWNKAIAVPTGNTIAQQLVDIDDNPVIQQGMVYAAAYQGSIVALTLQNGAVFWQHPISSDSGLAVGPNRLFITDTDGNIWAYQLSSGDIFWHQPHLMNRDLTSPVIVGNAIVVADMEGVINWLSRATGVFIARTQAPGPVNVRPLIKNDVAYVITNNGYVVAYRLQAKK